MILGVIYWVKVEFRKDLVVRGILAGLTESVGKALIQYAVVVGPAGPSSAMASLGGLELTVYQAITESRLPIPLEISGIVLSVVGSLIIVVPGVLRRIFCCGAKEERELKVKM
jgi:hypothetical protein